MRSSSLVLGLAVVGMFVVALFVGPAVVVADRASGALGEVSDEIVAGRVRDRLEEMGPDEAERVLMSCAEEILACSGEDDCERAFRDARGGSVAEQRTMLHQVDSCVERRRGAAPAAEEIAETQAAQREGLGGLAMALLSVGGCGGSLLLLVAAGMSLIRGR